MSWPAVVALFALGTVLLPSVRAVAEEATVEGLLTQVSAERIERSIRALAAFGTRHTASETESGKRGIGAARRWIREALDGIAAGTGARVEAQEFTAPAGPRLKEPTPVRNLLLWIPGTDPACRARTYVVTGHYDSRASDVRDATSDAPGANDDASGCAVVLEAARILAARPRRATVLLALVGGEEQGLLGSRHLAERLAADGVRVEGMVTNDVVGNTRAPDGSRRRESLRVFSEGLPRGEPEATRQARLAMGGENDGPSRQLARFVREVQRRDVRDLRVDLVFRPDRFLRGGDHLPFNDAGFAAVRFTEAVEDFDRQHQDVRREGEREYGDTPDAVDFDYVARVARLNLAVLSALADGPAAPGRPRIRAAAVEHSSTLSWEAVPEPGVTGYEVVWRTTEAGDWEHTAGAGSKTELTLPLSKDDVHLGVRTVGPSGLRSPVAYPFPAR